MSVKLKLCLLSLALVGASAFAQEESMTVVRDAETGKLRAPTSDEIASMQAQKAKTQLRMRAAAPKPTLPKMHANGARGVRLTDEFMSSSVVVRNADGSLQKMCFDSHDAAKKTVESGHTHVAHTIQPVTE